MSFNEFLQLSIFNFDIILEQQKFWKINTKNSHIYFSHVLQILMFYNFIVFSVHEKEAENWFLCLFGMFLLFIEHLFSGSCYTFPVLGFASFL